jgi:hypothetical protein
MYNIQKERPCPDCPIQAATANSRTPRADDSSGSVNPTREALLRFDAQDAVRAPRYGDGLFHLY